MSSLRLPRLREDQWSIATHPARIKVLAMGRRWGKSVLGQATSLATSVHGGRVAWCVPAYKNGRPLWRLAESAVGELRKAKLARVNRSERTIEFPQTGGWLGIYSMDRPDSIRGESFHLVVLDEAAMIAEEAWTDAIQPTLADFGGDAILISTPKGRNWFWKEWIRGQDRAQEEVRSWTAPTSDNPNPRIKKAAEMARERVPERTFRQEWLAEFVDDGGGVFRGVSTCATLEGLGQPEHANPRQTVMGVDWGKQNDFTVLCTLDANTRELVDYDRFNQIDWHVQRQRLNVMYERWRPTTILAERNSIGDPNIEALQREGLPVQPFLTTNATKAQVIEGLSLAIETRQVSYPRIPELIGELEAYEMDRSPSGLVRYGAPSGMHDDCVMALALAYHAADRGRVEIGPSLWD